MCRQYPSCILPLSITGLLSASLGFLCERNLSLSSFFSVTNRTTKSNLRKEGVYFILNSQIIIPHCQESGQEHRQKPEPETLGEMLLSDSCLDHFFIHPRIICSRTVPPLSSGPSCIKRIPHTHSHRIPPLWLPLLDCIKLRAKAH